MPKLVIVCNYAPTQDCKSACEKCRYLLAMQIIDLDKLPTPKTNAHEPCSCD